MDRTTSKQSRFTTDLMDSALTPIPLGTSHHNSIRHSQEQSAIPSPRGINHPDPRQE